MYKAVQDYIDKLNELRNETIDVTEDEMPDNLLEDLDKDEKERVRDKALEWLNDILGEYGYEEEFVTAFAVYCNFFILNGLHIEDSVEWGLDEFYGKNNMDEEEIQYLEYIRHGILGQDIECFAKAGGIYGFGVPYLYIYTLCFLELCDRDDEDYEIDKDGIINLYNAMEYWKALLPDELREVAVPKDLSECSDDEKMWEAKEYFSSVTLLPKIVILNFKELMHLYDMDILKTKIKELHESSVKTPAEFQDGADGWTDAQHNEGNYDEYLDKLEDVLTTLWFVTHKEDEEDGEDGESGEYSENNGVMSREVLDRSDFLRLPEFVPEKRSRNIVLAKEMGLNAKNESLIAQNEKMVEDYSHSIENIIKPSLIAEVAEYLREDEKNRGLYNKIMRAYFSEVITRNECRLLKMMHSGFVSQGAIRENISKAKIRNDENSITIEKIGYKALSQISMQLAENSQQARFMFILEKMSGAGIDSNMIDSKLWESSNDKDAIYRMYNDKLNFTVEISEDLKKVELNEEEVGTSFLYTRIVELVSNALTYGDYGNDKKFDLKIYTETAEISDYIVIEMTNKIGDRSFSKNREGNGLNATGAMLERINFDNDEVEFVSAHETDSGYFVTKMYIDADLYI